MADTTSGGRSNVVHAIILGVTASRKGLTEKQHLWLVRWLEANPALAEVHHGDCIGGDAEIHRLIRLTFSPDDESKRTVALKVHPCIADSQRAFCKAKGPDDEWFDDKDPLRRNHDIVDACTLLIAFPGEMSEKLRSGTWSTIRYARKVGRKTIIVLPNGETQ